MEEKILAYTTLQGGRDVMKEPTIDPGSQRECALMKLKPK